MISHQDSIKLLSLDKRLNVQTRLISKVLTGTGHLTTTYDELISAIEEVRALGAQMQELLDKHSYTAYAEMPVTIEKKILQKGDDDEPPVVTKVLHMINQPACDHYIQLVQQGKVKQAVTRLLKDEPSLTEGEAKDFIDYLQVRA